MVESSFPDSPAVAPRGQQQQGQQGQQQQRRARHGPRPAPRLQTPSVRVRRPYFTFSCSPSKACPLRVPGALFQLKQ